MTIQRPERRLPRRELLTWGAAIGLGLALGQRASLNGPIVRLRPCQHLSRVHIARHHHGRVVGPVPAALECTLLGPELEFQQDALVAVSGAHMTPRLDGVEMHPDTAFSVKAGQVLRFDFPKAGARMYLFDLCERLFARRDPVLAQQFREALRGAKDRVSMLDVGEAMLEEVAMTAGAERAASLRQRLDQLLPYTPVQQSGPFELTQPADLA